MLARQSFLRLGVGAAAIAVTIYFVSTRKSRAIRALISKSMSAHRSKAYEESLAAALEACKLAEAERGSELHETALLHLAGVHAAQRDHENALRVLDEALALAEEMHGSQALELVPILHARAEIFEADDGQPFAAAAAALTRARDIRRAVCGEQSIQSARASFNLASLLSRGAQEHDLDDARRAELMARIEALMRDGSAVAVATGEGDEAADAFSALLDTLADDPYEDEHVRQVRKRLQELYHETFGEGWQQREDDDAENNLE